MYHGKLSGKPVTSSELLKFHGVPPIKLDLRVSCVQYAMSILNEPHFIKSFYLDLVYMPWSHKCLPKTE
jgi:hypothetical protein